MTSMIAMPVRGQVHRSSLMSSSTMSMPVFVGVDTHKLAHEFAVIDSSGGLVARQRLGTDTKSCRQAVAWLRQWDVLGVGVEQTGTYGAELTRVLRACGLRVVEVDRPDVWVRARAGKSDPIDALAAAEAVRNGRAGTVPKDSTGIVAAIAHLHAVRHSAIKARTAALTQIGAEAITAPDGLRDRLGTTNRQIVHTSHRFRIDRTRLADPEQATKLALKHLAGRITALDTEIDDLDHALADLVTTAAPRLLERPGVGINIAAQLLITTGQNIDRIGSEAKFARLTGIAPIPASTGQSRRMRLHRGGDRAANSAIHLVAIGRLRYHQPAQDYMARRISEGLSKKDTIRAMKRLIARELFGALKADLKALDAI